MPKNGTHDGHAPFCPDDPHAFFAILSGSYLAKAGYRQVNPFFPGETGSFQRDEFRLGGARSKSRDVACGKRVATSLDTNGRFGVSHKR
jgi:hypothetical protein